MFFRSRLKSPITQIKEGYAFPSGVGIPVISSNKIVESLAQKQYGEAVKVEMNDLVRIYNNKQQIVLMY